MAKSLVLQLARFGDLVQTKRLILTLQAESEVHLALDASLVPLARLVYPKVHLHALRVHDAPGRISESALLVENAKVFAALQNENFGEIYNLNRSPFSLAISGLFKPERVHGYKLEHGQAVTPVWAEMASRWTAQRRSAPINLVDFWAFFHPRPLEPGKVNPTARPKNHPGSGGGQRIGIALSGREARRSLPPAYLARAVEAIFAARKGPELVLLGSTAEQAHARALGKNLSPGTQSRVRDLTGKTTLVDLHDLISSLDMLLTPDTGLMHLAAHLGVPVMATFLSSAWAWETGPYGLGHLVWQAVQPCSPCLESAPCPHSTICLEAFRSDDWLRHLAGRHSGAWPNNLVGLVSTLDELGGTYLCVDGDEDILQRDERVARRALLSEYLGLLRPGERPAVIPQHVSDELLEAADWMI